MNHTILLCLLLFVNPFIGTSQDCQNPISNANFKTAFNLIASQATDQKKLERSLELVDKNCLMSAQIKNISVLFLEDSYRLDFGRAAYQATFDRVNFFDVYDAFTSLSFALRLYDHTQSQQPFKRPMPPRDVLPKDEPAKEVLPPKFAEIVYPSTLKYEGNKGCDGPVHDQAGFNTLAIQVAAQPSDESKHVAIINAANEFCLGMGQLMKLTSLINSEKLKLNTLNESFSKIYDQDNFLSARALFTSVDLQNQWRKSAEFALAPPPPVCAVQEVDMKSILKSVQAKNFPNEKLDLISAIKKDRCFNVAQIRTLSKEFPHDSNKLEAMKLLYANCPDQPDYYKLVDELSFAFMREDLTKFIKTGGKD